MENLTIKNLSVLIEGKTVVNNVSLTIAPGQLHVVMGPNGSGKSSLLYAIMGHPNYQVQSSKFKVQNNIELNGNDITDAPPEDRAKAGLALAFQNPITVPGVSMSNLLKVAYAQIHGKKKFKPVAFHKKLHQQAQLLSLKPEFLRRSVNDGFSGGEKKKAEMFQLLALAPRVVLLDEIDTGLDIDALKSVASGITKLQQAKTSILLVTHYQRILQYLSVDRVHVMKQGVFVRSGGEELITHIEQKGYAAI